MTMQEFGPVAMGLKAAYGSPHFLPDEEAVSIWYRLLCDLPVDMVRASVYRHISTSKYPPTIAEIREGCRMIAQPVERDWSEGWGMVQAAIERYGMYDETRALSHLRERDPVTADVVLRLGWRSLCQSEDQVADRANFRTIYGTETTRKKERDKLPVAVRELLEDVSRGMVLIAGGGGYEQPQEL